MGTDNKSCETSYDPIGIELGIAIFSTAITVISFVYQLGPASSRRREFHAKTRVIQRELLRLHNTLDDFVLLLERTSHQEDEAILGRRKPTISDTLFRLQERDYYRWIDIEDAVMQIHQKIYGVISEFRELVSAEEVSDVRADTDVTRQADELILTMGQSTFELFVVGLRRLLDAITLEVNQLAHNQ